MKTHKKSWVDTQLDNSKIARAAFEELFKEYEEKAVKIMSLQCENARLKAALEQIQACINEDTSIRKFQRKYSNLSSNHNRKTWLGITISNICNSVLDKTSSQKTHEPLG